MPARTPSSPLRIWLAHSTRWWSLRVQQDWSERFTQILQYNMGWDANTPVGTGSWYGLYLINIFHMSPKLDLLCRAEWFDDVKGTRTGIEHQLLRGDPWLELASRQVP